MEEITILNNVIIDDVEDMVDRLKNSSGIYNLNIKDIVNFIKTEVNTFFYFDEKMCIKQEGDKGIKYLWLDTGLETADGKPLFISLLYQGGYYIGHYIGDWRFLSRNIISYFPNNTRIINENLKKFEVKYDKRIFKRNVKHLEYEIITENNEIIEENKTEIARMMEQNGIEITKEKNIEHNDSTCINTVTCEKGDGQVITCTTENITENVEKLLMINNWKSIDGLDRYIKIIGTRIGQLIEDNREEYYIINNLGSVVVNTGLLNQFGADIHIMYRLNLKFNTYDAYKIFESKTDYLENDFTKDQILKDILPITFFDKNEEIFDATIDDFDINHRSLLHIIEERRDRFPDNVQVMSDNTIATKINNAIELGLKMQKRDRNYAKPSYSSRTKGIAWMMPLHMNNEMTEEPELVLVVKKTKVFYEIKTILPYDDTIKDRITALALYNGLW